MPLPVSDLKMMSNDKEQISIEDAEGLLFRAFAANNVSELNARSVARALVAAEAEGQVGHGFSRLADYVAQARSGKTNGHAVAELTVSGPSAALIDGMDGFAYPAMETAIDWGVEAARTTGAATMGITRSHHCGALSIQVEKIARAGLVGMMVANAPSAIAPWGSKTPVFGTNPIAFSAPRPGGNPLIIDLSLSRVARGKVMNAKKLGKPIPEGWALDADGNPTTDPEAALAGSMVPIGEAKGTALALMVEILSAAFTGANASMNVSSFFTADGPPPGAGQFFAAFRPHDAAGFAARLEAILASIEELEGARLPGTRRAAAIRAARADGIMVPTHYLDSARALADGGG